MLFWARRGLGRVRLGALVRSERTAIRWAHRLYFSGEPRNLSRFQAAFTLGWRGVHERSVFLWASTPHENQGTRVCFCGGVQTGCVTRYVHKQARRNVQTARWVRRPALRPHSRPSPEVLNPKTAVGASNAKQDPFNCTGVLGLMVSVRTRPQRYQARISQCFRSAIFTAAPDAELRPYE